MLMATFIACILLAHFVATALVNDSPQALWKRALIQGGWQFITQLTFYLGAFFVTINESVHVGSYDMPVWLFYVLATMKGGLFWSGFCWFSDPPTPYGTHPTDRKLQYLRLLIEAGKVVCLLILFV